MTDTKELDKIIKNSGLKYNFIARRIGISYYSLRKKIDNQCVFLANEISVLCDLLGITDLELKERIFFTNKVDK